MANTITTTAIPEDLKFLKDNNIKVADAIRAYCERLRAHKENLLLIENQRLLKNIEGLQNEVARLTSQVKQPHFEARK